MNNESATETIREAVRVRNIKFNLTWLARDLEIGVGALEAFATAKGNLSDDTLAALTKIIWAGHGMFDPVTDSFEPVLREPPKPMTGLPVLDRKSLPRYRAGAAQGAHKLEREAIHKPDDKNRTRAREA